MSLFSWWPWRRRVLASLQILIFVIGVPASRAGHAQELGDTVADEYRRALLQDPQMLYAAQLSDIGIAPSLFSNENEWMADKGAREPVDVVLAFGTNAGYDLALTHDAQALVLADREIEPLIAQALIMRSFFRLANTRAEFLGLVRGRDLEDIPDELSSPDLFAAVKSRPSLITKRHADSGIVSRVRRTSGVAASHFVSAFYNAQVVAAGAAVQDEVSLRIVKESSALKFMSPMAMGQLLGTFDYLERHYSAPARRWQSRLKGRSFLEGEEEYQKLRRLFLENRVYYALADVADPQLYASVANFMKSKGLGTLLINTSNIFDVNVEDRKTSALNGAYAAYAKETCALLLEAGIQTPIHFRQTRGWQALFSFEHHFLRTPADADRLRFKPVPRWLDSLHNLVTSHSSLGTLGH